jgi:hypothetical protein
LRLRNRMLVIQPVHKIVLRNAAPPA